MSRPARRPDLVTELDRFENHWIPIAKIVLQGNHAEVATELFRNIERADGNEAAFTVAIFFERLESMARGEAPYGQQGPQVREYLRSRGLSDEIVAQAKEDLELLKDVEQRESPVETIDEEAMKAAEEAMWQWYLEWSAIVRKVITDGNLLRILGFKKRKSRSSSGAEIDIVETDDPGEVTALPEPTPLALPAE